VILSDGDVVFQPRKVERSGIDEAVSGHVLIYIHKEEALTDVERRYPAVHYVVIDHKLRSPKRRRIKRGGDRSVPRQTRQAIAPFRLSGQCPEALAQLLERRGVPLAVTSPGERACQTLGRPRILWDVVAAGHVPASGDLRRYALELPCS
jgi:hypothetical protein